MLINIQQPTMRVIPADNIRHGHRIENLSQYSFFNPGFRHPVLFFYQSNIIFIDIM